MVMPIQFFDGYDALDSTHELIKWTGGSVTAGSPGRFGYGQYCNVSTNVFRSFPAGPFVYGCAAAAFTWPTIAGSPTVFEFGNGNQHCRLIRDSNGFLVMRDANSTDIATYNTAALQANTFYAIGFAAKWSSSGAGQMRAWLNGHLIMSADGVDTDNNASASDEFGYILMGSPWDDFYVSAADTITGSLSDEYRGDLIVRESFPITDGEHEDFTPLSGSDSFAMIDEIGPDDDTTYISSNTAGHRSCFGMTPASADIAAIIAIQMNSVARFDTTGPHDIRNYIRDVGVANHDEAAQAIAVNYVNYWNVRETDPVTGSPWTINGFNSRQFGIKLEL